MTFLSAPTIEYMDGEAQISFVIPKEDAVEIAPYIDDIKTDETYDLIVKKRTLRRSLNANSYHWLLCEQIATKLRTSKYEIHNQLMCSYGIDWLDEDGKHVYVLMKDDNRYLSMETTHYRPTDAVEDRKGVAYRWFVLLLPSHLMDSFQMATLIDGTISEAKELGIDVRTPEEIERIKALWQSTAN